MHPSMQHKHLIHTGPQLFIADWLSRQPQGEGGDKIPGMGISINVKETGTDILECMATEKYR